MNALRLHLVQMAASIAVLGAGSWGTALAEVQARAGRKVLLWDHSSERLEQIQKRRENVRYHPGHRLSHNIDTTSEISQAVQGAGFVILAVPSHAIRVVLERVIPAADKDAIFVCAAKGLELETLRPLSSVAADLLGEKEAARRYCVLSGPTFAREVIRQLPAALVVACRSDVSAHRVQETCHTDTFRVLVTNDVIGVEIGGALKNVVAIATGVSDGLELGQNARAALITRALAEVSRIGRKLGANPLTFAGLAGIGDLLLTCVGDLSRNRQVGLKLAQGKNLRTILREIGQVAEGIRTAKSAYRLAQKLGVDAPILRETYLTLYERKNFRKAIADLLSMPPGDERE